MSIFSVCGTLIGFTKSVTKNGKDAIELVIEEPETENNGYIQKAQRISVQMYGGWPGYVQSRVPSGSCVNVVGRLNGSENVGKNGKTYQNLSAVGQTLTLISKPGEYVVQNEQPPADVEDDIKW